MTPGPAVCVQYARTRMDEIIGAETHQQPLANGNEVIRCD